MFYFIEKKAHQLFIIFASSFVTLSPEGQVFNSAIEGVLKFSARNVSCVFLIYMWIYTKFHHLI